MITMSSFRMVQNTIDTPNIKYWFTSSNDYVIVSVDNFIITSEG